MIQFAAFGIDLFYVEGSDTVSDGFTERGIDDFFLEVFEIFSDKSVDIADLIFIHFVMGGEVDGDGHTVFAAGGNIIGVGF